MKKITSRLYCIAELIGMGKTVADIGTDHGFLPIYLQQSCGSPHVVLTDVSASSLQKAIENIGILYKKEEIPIYFDFRCGSGLAVMQANEVDTVVFAGMGGELMVELMAEDILKTRSFSKFVFQPRTGQGFLRYWLMSNGFEIERENLVVEGKFICEVFSAIYKENTAVNLEPFIKGDVRYEITRKMISENLELGIKLLNYKIKKENLIKIGLEKTSENVCVKKNQNFKNIKYLQELLSEFQK
ncbi:MAG: tRNA (adenine(22)-N(1))-methyltransferase [Eubacteriales bacterium]